MKITFPSKLSAIALACSCVFTGSEALALTEINSNHDFTGYDKATGIDWDVKSGMIRFMDNSDADNALMHFSESSVLIFNDNSSAGNAKLSFADSAGASFNGNSSAGNAELYFAKGTGAVFEGSSSAGSAIINSDGQIIFKDLADAENATLMGSGTFDFTSTSGREGDNVVHAGLIDGNGRIELGDNTFVIGNEQSNTNFSGVIEGSGALIKQGSGHIVLSGRNTYQGDTYINSGGLILQGGSESNPIIQSPNIYIGNKDKPNTQTYTSCLDGSQSG